MVLVLYASESKPVIVSFETPHQACTFGDAMIQHLHGWTGALYDDSVLPTNGVQDFYFCFIFILFILIVKPLYMYKGEGGMTFVYNASDAI